MRTSGRWTKTAILMAGLGLGSALAQEVPVKGAGPDQDQANNERYWGIVNNSNNTYKTWPSTLSDPAFDKWAGRHRRVANSTPPQAPTPPKAEATSAAPVPAPAPQPEPEPEPAEAPRPARARRSKPTVPAWEDVLLGVRSSGQR